MQGKCEGRCSSGLPSFCSWLIRANPGQKKLGRHKLGNGISLPWVSAVVREPAAESQDVGHGPPSGLWQTLVSAPASHCFYLKHRLPGISQTFTHLGRTTVLLETHPHSYLESSSKGKQVELFLASSSLFWENPPKSVAGREQFRWTI